MASDSGVTVQSRDIPDGIVMSRKGLIRRHEGEGVRDKEGTRGGHGGW